MSDKVRTDDVLYTGINSASFNKSQKAKSKRRAVRETQRIVLTPAGELLTTEIARERELIGKELANLIHVDTDKEDVKSIVVGLKMADSRLASLHQKLNNILREQKPVEEVEDGADV